LLDDPKGRAQRALGVVLVRGGRAEQREDPVAGQILHGAAEGLRRAYDPRDGLAHDDLHLLRVEALGERGRPDEVGENRRDHLAFLAHARRHPVLYCGRSAGLGKGRLVACVFDIPRGTAPRTPWGRTSPRATSSRRSPTSCSPARVPIRRSPASCGGACVDGSPVWTPCAPAFATHAGASSRGSTWTARCGRCRTDSGRSLRPSAARSRSARTTTRCYAHSLWTRSRPILPARSARSASTGSPTRRRRPRSTNCSSGSANRSWARTSGRWPPGCEAFLPRS